MPKPFGFNVFGHVSGNLGLGISARNIIQTLLDNGFPVAVFDVNPGLGRWKEDLRFESLTVSAPEALPYAVNLLIFPPPSFVALLGRYGSHFANTDHFNAAFVWWELPAFPPGWRPALEFFDVLVAPSAFIRHTLNFTLSHTMTIRAQQPLALPANIAPDRQRFGLGPDDVVYVTSFELASDPKRKNVLGVVDSFDRGLARCSEARLIIKVNNFQDSATRNPTIAALHEATARDSRIRLLTEPLSYEDVLSLYASSDVFVSLHRSEGLGLGPMEAMAFGKPCIATAWSGNMDYMDHTNACLIPYTLVPVTGGSGAYADDFLKGCAPWWADPDLDEAAAWMRRLAEDRDLRLSMGKRAAAAIAQWREEASRTKFVSEIQARSEQRRYIGPQDFKSRLEAAFAASVAARPPAERAVAKFRRATSQALDRHVLWRFR